MRTIKLAITFFISAVITSIEADSQVRPDMFQYLNNKQISNVAKDYYLGKFSASDDPKTFSIIDSLNTRNDSTRYFYIYLVSKMMIKADGALSEALGNDCKHFIEWHPNQAIALLYSVNGEADFEFINNWATDKTS